MNESSSSGTATATAVMRNQRRRHSGRRRRVGRARLGLDGDNPVMPHVEGQFFVESIDESRAVLIQERDEPDRAFLRVTVGKHQGTCADELAAERLVAAFCG